MKKLDPFIERPRGELNERVLVCLVGGCLVGGTIKYVGPVHWSKVSHVGIVLDKPVGDIDGEVGGVRYFSCGPNQGWMEPLAELTCRGNWRPTTVKQKAAAKTVGQKAATAKQKVAAKTIGQKAATPKQKSAVAASNQKRTREEPKNKLCGIVSSGLIRKCGRSKA